MFNVVLVDCCEGIEYYRGDGDEDDDLLLLN